MICLRNAILLATLSSVLTVTTGCTGDSASIGGTSGLVISGQLGGSSLIAANLITQKQMSNSGSVGALEYGDLEIVAEASTTPPTTAEASVNSDGTFSVDLGADAKGTAVSVKFVNEETGSIVGEMKFTDDTKTDLNGNSKSDGAVVVNSSLALGTVNLTEDGTIEVPRTAISANIQADAPVSSVLAFDPTGQWTMAAYDGTVPTGFNTVETCSMDPNHHGPCIGFPITLARFAGTDFDPGSNCAIVSGAISSCPAASGTVESTARYALSIWGGDYNDSIGACGGTTGFSADEARAFGRINITTLPTIGASTVAFGPYVFTQGASFGTDMAPFNEAWMLGGATSNHDEYDCRPFSVSGTTKISNAWACKSAARDGMTQQPVSGGAVGWQVGIEGSGCRDAAQKPLNVTNWANMGMADSCLDQASTEYPGFKENTCTYTAKDHDGVSTTATISFTCKHTGAQFTDAAGSPSSTPLVLPMGQYLGQPQVIIAQGAACLSPGAATPAAKLAAYRCYAQAYWQGGGSNDAACGRDYQFDWQATNPANFVKTDDFKGRPKNAFVTNILNYATDGKSATLEDQENESITIQTGEGNSTFCKVLRRTQLTFKSITATKMLIELKESGRVASTDAACVAAGNTAATCAAADTAGTVRPAVCEKMDGHLIESLRGEKLLFYVNKQ